MFNSCQVCLLKSTQYITTDSVKWPLQTIQKVIDFQEANHSHLVHLSVFYTSLFRSSSIIKVKNDQGLSRAKTLIFSPKYYFSMYCSSYKEKQSIWLELTKKVCCNKLAAAKLLCEFVHRIKKQHTEIKELAPHFKRQYLEKQFVSFRCLSLICTRQ